MSEKIQKLKFRKFSLNSRPAIIGLIGSMAIMMTVSCGIIIAYKVKHKQ